MFIISLTYKSSIENVEQLIPQHTIFLNKHYESGQFIASGRKEQEESLLRKQHQKKRWKRSLQKIRFIFMKLQTILSRNLFHPNTTKTLKFL